MTSNITQRVRNRFVAVWRGFTDLRLVLIASSIAEGRMFGDSATAALCTRVCPLLSLTALSEPRNAAISTLYSIRSLTAVMHLTVYRDLTKPSMSRSS